MAKVCGWTIPGYPIYVCILKPHGDDVPHKPQWQTTAVLHAVDVFRRHGEAVHGTVTPGP
jgi:hypothetical protein